MMNRTHILIAAYLLAIVIANLTVAAFGVIAVIPNSFVLIALDLTARDALHEVWHGVHLRRNMALLIVCGSVLSALLDYQALPIALASCLAFGASGAVDTLLYARLERYAWLIKANGSNVASALTDSLVFLSLLAALTGLPWATVPLLVAAQWLAKTTGGALWSLLLARRAQAVRA